MEDFQHRGDRESGQLVSIIDIVCNVSLEVSSARYQAHVGLTESLRPKHREPIRGAIVHFGGLPVGFRVLQLHSRRNCAHFTV